MQIDTAEDLIRTLHNSGLFSSETLRAVSKEFELIGNDPPSLMRHLVQTDRLSVYQLRKLVHGKASELFLGQYVIFDKLGEGGMGKVYRARRTRSGPEVALKVVRPSLLANPVIRGRYQREAQAAKALTHPNVVGLLEAGDADGKYYLAMEFVDGIDLSRMVREYGVLPISEACEYIRQASLGLQHAHDSGFVHRDIKPSNIVVSGERHLPGTSEPAIAKILDMGLVRMVGFEESEGGLDLTRDGTVVGTPDYMAPEQAKNSSSVDHRADLYSLGCTFYFLFTGKSPFPVGSPIEKLLKHQLDPPPPLQLARPDVPTGLARIVARLTAKRVEDRIQTARELAEILAPYTRHSGPVPTGNTAITMSALRGSTDVPSQLAPPSTMGSVQNSGMEAKSTTPAAPAADGPAAVSPTDRTPRPIDRTPAVEFDFAKPNLHSNTLPGAGHSKKKVRSLTAIWVGSTVAFVVIVLVLLLLVRNKF